MRVSIVNFYASIFACCSFVISIIILPLYTGGDQVHYRGFYAVLPSFGVLDGFDYYRSMLGSSEPIYFVVVYIFSGFLDKDILMSLLNSVLGYFLVLWLLKKKVSLVVVSLLLFNFYLLVLFFSAERLKLGLIFLIMSVVFSGAYRHLFAGFALLSHVQTIILVASRILGVLTNHVPPLFRGRLRIGLAWSVGAFLLSVAVLYMMSDHVAAKYEYYSQYSGGAEHLLKPMIFAISTLFYAKSNKVEAIFAHAPIVVAAFLIGGERVVIFSYFVFMFYALQVRRGMNFGVWLFSLYFLIKGVVFIGDIVVYGNGFYVQ